MADDAANAEEMRSSWDGNATRNAEFYILTDRRHWDPEAFMTTATETVDELLARWGANIPRGSMLEIGCGIGRMVTAFAPHFDLVKGIDVSGEMIAKGMSRGLPHNVSLQVVSGVGLDELDQVKFDFVFSYLVFQHIENADFIRAYIEGIPPMLAEEGKALIQFDTRPKSTIATLAHALPDRLLPRRHRRFTRRYRHSAAWVRHMVTAAGLKIVSEDGPDSEEHWFFMTKDPAAASDRLGSGPG